MECKIYQFENEICQEISSLSKLDNWHCFLALLEDYVIIFLMAATCSVSWYLYPLAVLIIGSRQRALATLLHEASHKILAKNKVLNFAIGTFFSGYFVLQTMGSYRESHVRFHHGHFGDIELHPDYKFAIEAGWYARPQSVEKFTLHNIVLPFLLAKVPSYLCSLIQHRLLDKQAQSSRDDCHDCLSGSYSICFHRVWIGQVYFAILDRSLFNHLPNHWLVY